MTQLTRVLGAAVAVVALICIPVAPVLGACSSGGVTISAPSSASGNDCVPVSAKSSSGVELRVTDARGNVLFDSTESNEQSTLVEAEICLDSDVEGPIEVEATDAAGNVTTHTITIQ